MFPLCFGHRTRHPPLSFPFLFFSYFFPSFRLKTLSLSNLIFLLHLSNPAPPLHNPAGTARPPREETTRLVSLHTSPEQRKRRHHSSVSNSPRAPPRNSPESPHCRRMPPPHRLASSHHLLSSSSSSLGFFV